MTRSARSTRFATACAVLLAAALALTALSGCGAKPAPNPGPPTVPTATFPVTITDDSGQSVTVNAEPKRIVSLAPANTEILFELGLGERVVGVTTFDDYPSQVASITKVGDFTTPNIEAIAAAKPDLILATTGVQADALAKLKALGATVIAIDPQSLSGVYTDIQRVGQATGTTAEADAIVGGMQVDVVNIQQAVENTAAVTAFVEISQNPLYTVGSGTLIDELITLAGGKNVVKQPGYVAYSAEQLIKADPQVYMATKGSMSDPAALSKRAGFAKLQAVKNNRVVILDDNLVSRPGPRIVQGLRQIADALHPGELSSY